MMSAVTYLTLGALLARSHDRRAVKVFFLLVAALLGVMVGVSRVYLGVHWPTDVLAGWAAGSVWGLAVLGRGAVAPGSADPGRTVDHRLKPVLRGILWHRLQPV